MNPDLRLRLRMRLSAHKARACVLRDCLRLSRLLHWRVPPSDLVLALDEVAEVHATAFELGVESGEVLVTH